MFAINAKRGRQFFLFFGVNYAPARETVAAIAFAAAVSRDHKNDNRVPTAGHVGGS